MHTALYHEYSMSVMLDGCLLEMEPPSIVHPPLSEGPLMEMEWVSEDRCMMVVNGKWCITHMNHTFTLLIHVFNSQVLL